MQLSPPQNLKQRHQQTAQRLLDACAPLKAIFQDQWMYLWTVTSDNAFIIDEVNHRLIIADGLLIVECLDNFEIQFSTPQNNISVQKLADFIFNDIPFIFAHKASHHALFLQSKVQLFRQLLTEEVFKWVDGENRVEQCLYNLNQSEAMVLDRIMIDAEYYDEPYLLNYIQYGTAIPLQVELNFKHLSLVNSILGDNFLSVKTLIPVYDRLCTSAAQFLPSDLYRMAEISFEEQFYLSQLQDLKDDFLLLKTHAQQSPKLLALTPWIKRGYWQYQDIFSKENFLNKDVVYWNDDLAEQLPLFHFRRSVNWFYKQQDVVVDWMSSRLSEPNIRLACSILSFVDTQNIHPHIIQLTLKYFEQVIGRLFIFEVHHLSVKQSWFGDLAEFHQYQLKDSNQSTALNNASKFISASILYLDEWLDLVKTLDQKHLISAKWVFKRLATIMQAYMIFLNDLIQDIPEELVPYIEPSTQDQTRFVSLAQHYQLDVAQFRAKFKHSNSRYNRSNSVFDSYVADYLIDHFQHDRPILKNMTWTTWYQKALRWHQQIHFEDTLISLKLRHTESSWSRVTPQAVMFSENWKFEELNSLEQIIHESVSYKHCLALSYTQRIIDGEYVAFHMSNLKDESKHLTLGCFYRYQHLHFDQLRLPNNEMAEKSVIREAQAFIQKMNEILVWHFLDSE